MAHDVTCHQDNSYSNREFFYKCSCGWSGYVHDLVLMQVGAFHLREGDEGWRRLCPKDAEERRKERQEQLDKQFDEVFEPIDLEDIPF